MANALKSNNIKSVDVVEITLAVPQDQMSTLRQMAMRYILDHNDESTAFKLFGLTRTKLRDDIKVWKS